MFIYGTLRTAFVGLSAALLTSCAAVHQSGKPATASNHIITPSHYYTSLKAKNLSDRYKENLERLIVNIVRNPKTGRLQFANNIVSTGGIGFFTHSASQLPDERYLEVVLGVAEVLDEHLDFNAKVDRLFSEYGAELLAILCGDAVIYKDPDVAGYGLNLSWRAAATASSAPRITLERAVIYLSKEEAARFLNRRISKEAALSTATVFAVYGDGRAGRIAYVPPRGEQLARLPEHKAADQAAEDLKRVIEPQVREKDLAPAAASQPQPDRPKPVPPAKPRESVAKKPPPSRIEPTRQVKEADSRSEKTVEKRPAPPAPAAIEETAKQQKPAKPPQPDQQAALAKPKPPEKIPEPAKELRSGPEAPPQKTEKVGAPQPSAPKAASPKPIAPDEKLEDRPAAKSETKAITQERQRPVEKKAEGQPPVAPTPVDQQAKASQQKSAPAPMAKEPAKTPARESIKSEARPILEVPPETKARAQEAKKAQSEPASPVQAKPPAATEEKLADRESAPAADQSMILAKKKAGPESAAEAYIIQVTFPRKADAELWSGRLNKQGYRVSMTAVGQQETVRLRVGAFESSSEAKNHLDQLEKQGLKNGIVLQRIQ